MTKDKLIGVLISVVFALIGVIWGMQVHTNQKLWEQIGALKEKNHQLEMENAVAKDRIQFVIQHIAWNAR